MEIIPVIDVMGGKVVHAQGGVREDYPDLQSQLTTSTRPLQVVRDFIAFEPFPQIYIADLDAIRTGQFNHQLYAELTQKFPNTVFWVRCGDKNRKRLLRLCLLSEYLACRC